VRVKNKNRWMIKGIKKEKESNQSGELSLARLNWYFNAPNSSARVALFY